MVEAEGSHLAPFCRSTPNTCGPLPLSAATSMQRGDVLGFEPKLAAPFGAKVLVRKRQLEGPKLEDLASKVGVRKVCGSF